MAEENIGSLVVMEGETLKGVVTERQYARHVALKGPVSPATRVLDIMETTIFYARPEQSVAECMAVMTNKRVRHLPVIDDGQLIGIISIGDLVKSTISDQNFVIDQLEHFLHGGTTSFFLVSGCAHFERGYDAHASLDGARRAPSVQDEITRRGRKPAPALGSLPNHAV
jgi:hypothetical protein